MEQSIIGNFYNPCDNSYCINLNTMKPSYICPWIGDNKFNPNKNEIGAKFTIVSEPYFEKVLTLAQRYAKYAFINVKSSITYEVYRTLYYESNVIENTKLKIENLIEEYHKIVPSLEGNIVDYLLNKVSKFEGKYIDLTYLAPEEREAVFEDATIHYSALSIKKSKTTSQIKEIIEITFIDEYDNQFEENIACLNTDLLIELFNRINEHIENNGYNNIVNE